MSTCFGPSTTKIGLGDFVIARRGRKTLAAAGKVVRTGFYAPGRNPFLASPDSSSNFEIIFKGKLQIYEDAEGAIGGQQYATDIGVHRHFGS